jgi:hypothetical protein
VRAAGSPKQGTIGDSAAGAAICARIADAGRHGQKGHSASGTGAFGPWRSCAARRVQMTVPVVESPIEGADG